MDDVDIDNPQWCRLDEDGFFILLNRETYASFVAADWTLERLQAHVIEQGAAGHIAAVYLGQELADSPVDIRARSSARPSTRETRAVLAVAGDGLWVASYTDVTMAAQFEDEAVVRDRTESAHVLVRAGRYAVTFRQVRETAQPFNPGHQEPVLEVVLTPTETPEGTIAVAAGVGGGFAWLQW